MVILLAVVVISAFPLSARADPIIEVSPWTHDFGDVQVGTSSTTIIIISNIDGHVLVISSIGFGGGSSSDFSITLAPTLPAVVDSGEWIDVEVTFSPSSEGYASAVLEIESNDPVNSLVKVDLGGVGVAVAPPLVTIEDILTFFDESVDDGTLSGRGRGWLAKLRLCLMRQMLEIAGEFIEHDRINAACFMLQRAYLRTDGLPWPRDFVEGEATDKLADMIWDLRVGLGCG